MLSSHLHLPLYLPSACSSRYLQIATFVPPVWKCRQYVCTLTSTMPAWIFLQAHLQRARYLLHVHLSTHASSCAHPTCTPSTRTLPTCTLYLHDVLYMRAFWTTLSQRVIVQRTVKHLVFKSLSCIELTVYKVHCGTRTDCWFSGLNCLKLPER